MKYQEGNIYNRADLGPALKKIVSDLLSDKLAVEGNGVALPEDLDIEVKVKSNVDEAGGSLSIKIGWDNLVAEEVVAEDQF